MTLRPVPLVIAAALLYAFVLSFFSVRQHAALQTAMNDLGNMEQAIWQASQGNLSMPVSNHVYSQIVSRTAIHANLIFWVIAPFYKLFPYPEMLLILTSLACAAAGAGLYFYAAHHLRGSPWALAVPLAFWMSPIVHDANLFDFHVVTLSTAFLVWAAWSFDTGRLKMGWVFLGLTALCKENMILVLIAYGFYLCLSGRRKLGIRVIFFSGVYGMVLLGVLIPALNKNISLMGPDKRFDWLFETNAGFLENVLRVVKHLVSFTNLRLVLYFLLSGALAALSAWPMLLVMAPELLIGLLTNNGWMVRLTGTYYWITSLAVILMACTLAARHAAEQKRPPFPLLYPAAAALVFSFLFSPLPHSIASSFENFLPAGAEDILKELDGKMDPDKALCVQNNLGAHFAKRRDIASFLKNCRQRPAHYQLFHLRWTSGPDSGLFAKTLLSVNYQIGKPETLPKEIKKLLDSQEWGLVYQGEGFYLFERGAPSYADPVRMREIFEEDARIFIRQHQEASRSRFWWSGYLTGIPEPRHFASLPRKIWHSLTGTYPPKPA
jgi:uncharacterized membrane protein